MNPVMIPVVFINCSRFPFLDWIILLQKVFETRSRNMLRALVGQRVYLAKTGRGRPPVVMCSAVISSVRVVRSRAEWSALRPWTWVPAGSDYDWKPWTRVKHLYKLTDVQLVDPIIPPEGIRHGRVWMEYIRIDAIKRGA